MATVICKQCGAIFEVEAHQVELRPFCSQECAKASQEKFSPSRDQLLADVWLMTLTQAAEKYGVSDKAIAKRCERDDIPRPPRGFWVMSKSQKFEELLYTVKNEHDLQVIADALKAALAIKKGQNG